MYDYMIGLAADLWAGTAPSEVGGEYLRGQVELIADMGIAPWPQSVDHDHVKTMIGNDIRRRVQVASWFPETSGTEFTSSN